MCRWDFRIGYIQFAVTWGYRIKKYCIYLLNP